MDFVAFLKTASFGLYEGSVYERLRRDPELSFDPFLANGGLIYDAAGARKLEGIHREYLEIGQSYGIPMIALTDTWRASQERIDQSDFKGRPVNQDNARFLVEVRESYGAGSAPIWVAGHVGPRGDSYRPEQAPEAALAERLHAPQVQALAESGVDFLQASTLPAFPEARGLAAAMAKTDLPYVLSFVIRGNGALLDGVPLERAIETIDSSISSPPVGYAVNCVHPSVLASGLAAVKERRSQALTRIFGFQANSSDKSPEELDGLAELEVAEPERLANLAFAARLDDSLLFLGGCCGTDARHIESLARKWKMQAGVGG